MVLHRTVIYITVLSTDKNKHTYTYIHIKLRHITSSCNLTMYTINDQ